MSLIDPLVNEETLQDCLYRDWDGGLDTDGLDISQLDSYINDSNNDTMYFGDLGTNTEEIKNSGTSTARESTSRHHSHQSHSMRQLPASHIHQSHLPESPPDSASEPSYSPEHSNIPPNQKTVLTELYNSQTVPQSLIHISGYGSPAQRGPQPQHAQNITPHMLPQIQPPAGTIPAGHNFTSHSNQCPIQVDSTVTMPPGSPSGSAIYTQLVGGGCQRVIESVAKKRKFSEIGIPTGQNRSSVDIKQEPDQSSNSRQNSHNQLCSPATGVTTTSQSNAGPNVVPINSSGIHYNMDDEEFSLDGQNNTFLDPAFQSIRFQPFQQHIWGMMCDSSLKEISLLTFRVDADKGFNFSHPDEAFVCQKKNHFQITTHVQVSGTPCYYKASDGLKKIEKFCVHFYGVKTESHSQVIRVEQSQSDRSKRGFHPVQIEVFVDKIAKLTVGRLHFSETTSNNMRKKGKPNPDQRYFYLVVSLQAHCSDSNYPIILHSSEKIIVRASNPGQFESDMEYTFQRGCYPESIYHMGRVGINTDRPDEALSVHGNIKISGQILQPSDIRAKENITEVDTREQLNNVKSLRVVKYEYKENFAKNAGLRGKEVYDTGIIAQEVKKIIPDAVREAGDISLANGDKIRNFLLVNKDRIYMENIGAVKELCKVTGGLESGIGELEGMNTKLKRIDSLRSTASSTRASSVVSQISTVSHRSCRRHRRKKMSREELWSRKMLHISKMAIFCFMTLCLVAMSTLYIIEYRSRDSRIGLTNSIDGLNYTIISSHTTSMPFNFSVKTNPLSTEYVTYVTPSSINSSQYAEESSTPLTPRATFIVSIVPQEGSSVTRRPPVIGKPENCPAEQALCESYCCSADSNANIYESDSSDLVTRRYRLNGVSSDAVSSESEIEANKVFTTGSYTNSFSTTDLRDVELKDMPSKKSSNHILRYLRLLERPTHRRNLIRPKTIKRILNKRSVFRETMPKITIPELSAEVYNAYCLREDEEYFESCVNNTASNITYAIPLSKYMPYVNLTLQFKFRSTSNIRLFRQCSVSIFDNRTNACVQAPGDRSSKAMVRENNTITASLTNVGYWRRSSYRFALPLRSSSLNPCDGTSFTNRNDFVEMNFIFYRDCDG